MYFKLQPEIYGNGSAFNGKETVRFRETGKASFLIDEPTKNC